MLLGDIPGKQDTALKLLHPLLQQFYNHIPNAPFGHMLDCAVRFCFHLLNKDSDTMGEDQVRSRNLTLLIRIIVHHPYWDRRKSFTVAQFDLLMNYHLHICEGTDYDLINATFWMLEFGSSNTPERMRCYIDTIIRFMREEATCASALHAAWATVIEIASMAQDDESLREDFSKALASVVLLDPKRTMLPDNPFKEISFFNWSRDIPYLELLCTLTRHPTWHLQLHQNGHFDNCLVIAKTLLSQNGDLFAAQKYAVTSVAHIFAIIDALGDETHPFFNTVQAYPRWPLALHAWDYIFDTDLSQMSTEDDWGTISRKGFLDSLPSLIAYARKQSNDNNEPLIVLVEQVCHRLDEEKQQGRQGDAQHVHDTSLWYEETSALRHQIRMSLDASLTDI